MTSGSGPWDDDYWHTLTYEPSLAPTERLRRYPQEYDTIEQVICGVQPISREHKEPSRILTESLTVAA